MHFNPFLQFPIGARLWIGLALVWMACSREAGPEPADPAEGPQPVAGTTRLTASNNTVGTTGSVGTTGMNPPSSPGDPSSTTPPDDPSAQPTGTGVLVCDKYIRMVCGCAQKRQNPDLQRACDLARQSLPDWQKSHKEEGEELAVVKACQRAFLYIQSTGQCDDISY